MVRETQGWGLELDKDLIQVMVIWSGTHGEGDTGMGVELDKDLIQVSNLSGSWWGKERDGGGARQRLDPGQ